MIWLEAYLVAILMALFVSASITDLKKGVVSNKSILVALGAGIVGAIPYYAFFTTDCLASYSANIAISLTIGLILYAMGIWGAGDSKLFFTTIIVFPARIYCMGNRSLVSCFLMVAIVFIVAFTYVIVETVIVGIKQRDLFKLQIEKINWISYIKGFLFYFFLLNLVNTAFYIFLPDNLLADSILMTAIQFIVILIGMKLIEHTNWIHTIILGLTWVITLILHLSSLNLSNFSIFPYIVILILALFRTAADKYNYKRILVEDLKPGMILSMGSILGFAGSRVQGLPTISTEDLKSRLTKDEVESINRWSKTKKGTESIVIVRKIPFALFIGIGTAIFIVLEVALR